MRNTMSRSPNVLQKATLLCIAVAAISISLTLLSLELAVRIHRGRVLQVQSVTAELKNVAVVYHPRLGWLPRPSQLNRGGWTSNVDASGIRSNGRALSTGSR